MLPLPDDVPADVAAVVGCAVITGVGAAIETLRVEAGSRGCVIGCGGVGVNAIQGARVRGAAEIVAIDPSGERRDAAARVRSHGGRSTRATTMRSPSWSPALPARASTGRSSPSAPRPRCGSASTRCAPEARWSPSGSRRRTTRRRSTCSPSSPTRRRSAAPPTARSRRSSSSPASSSCTGVDGCSSTSSSSHRLPLESIDEGFDLSRRAQGMRPVLAITNDGRFD